MSKERNSFEFPDTFKVTSTIKNPKQYNVDELIKVVGNKILGYSEANIMVVKNDRLLSRLTTNDCELQAFLYNLPVPHHYTLCVRSNPSDSLELILCHEMVHFDQFERGDLEVSTSPVKFFWKGDEWLPSNKYNSRPWEIEAKERQNKIWKEFKNLYYK